MHAPLARMTARQRHSPSSDDDAVAVAFGADGGHPGLRPHRRGDGFGVAVDERDDFGDRAVAVRIVAGVAEPRQAALPVGGEQPQRVPALRAPGVGHPPPLENDVVDRALGQTPAHGEPGVAGADDDGGYARDRTGSAARRMPRVT